MHMIWILAALVAAPTAPPDKGVDPKDKVIDPNAKPMGPALDRGAPEVHHTVKDVPLPPLPEHPDPPPGTHEAHTDAPGGGNSPVFPAEPRGEEMSTAAKTATAGGAIALIIALAWLVRRRRRT